MAEPDLLVVWGGSFVQSAFGRGCWDKVLSRGLKSRKSTCVCAGEWPAAWLFQRKEVCSGES